MIARRNIPESAVSAIEILVNCPDIERIILFGSRAFGDHQPKSDVDIAVCGPNISRLKLASLRDQIASAPTLFQIAISHLERMPELLRLRVIETGVVIYERKKTH